MAIGGGRRRLAYLSDDPVNVPSMSLQIVAVIEDFQTYLAGIVFRLASDRAVNSESMSS